MKQAAVSLKQIVLLILYHMILCEPYCFVLVFFFFPEGGIKDVIK